MVPHLAMTRSPARGAAYRVEEIEGFSGFASLREEWNALLASGASDAPFSRHEWISAWLQAFAPGARLRVLVARGEDGRAAGMAPLLEEGRLGRRRLLAPANDHSCRVEWVLGPDPAGAVAALWSHLRDRMRWDLLLLRDLARDGPTSTHLTSLALADGHPQGRWESMRSPYIPLAGHPPVEQRLDAKFKSNLRRCLKRLCERGPASLRQVGRGDGLDPFLAGFFALEAAGWKGRRGSAIACDPRLVAFYTGVARAAAEGGWLSLRSLEVGDRPAAMSFAVRYRRTLYLLKPTYDEELGACAPGHLLLGEMVAESEAAALREIDFLGPDMPWKRDWAPQYRPHDWLYVYRPGLEGRARHTFKHRVRPLAKEVLRWWR